MRLRDIVEQSDVGRDIATKLGIYIDIQSLDIDIDGPVQLTMETG